MRISATTRSLTVLVLAGLLLSGCGKDTEKSPVAADPTTPAVSVTPTPTPTVTPTPTKKPKPTRTPPKPAEGDGDGEGDDSPATAGGGICSDLGPEDVSLILGGSVTGSAIPGGGCAFNQKGPRAPAISVVETSFADTPDGMNGAKSGATSSVEGEPVDLAGIGDGAFVVTGTAFGGADLQGAGAVRVGDRLVNVTLAQSAGLPRAKVRAMVVGVLKLAASELS